MSLNTVYYVIGTKDELKEHSIIELWRFPAQTKILPSDFDRNYMQRADRRTLISLPLDSKKASALQTSRQTHILSNLEPTIAKTLVITSPDAFWQTSNIVVIQVN